MVFVYARKLWRDASIAGATLQTALERFFPQSAAKHNRQRHWGWAKRSLLILEAPRTLGYPPVLMSLSGESGYRSAQQFYFLA